LWVVPDCVRAAFAMGGLGHAVTVAGWCSCSGGVGGVGDGAQGELSLDENLIISGAMGLVGKTVECRTRPLSNTFMLSQDTALNVDTVDAISDSGWVLLGRRAYAFVRKPLLLLPHARYDAAGCMLPSCHRGRRVTGLLWRRWWRRGGDGRVARVPVHAARDTTEVLGLLPVKNLIVLNPQDATPVSIFLICVLMNEQHSTNVPILCLPITIHRQYHCRSLAGSSWDFL